MRHYSSFYSTSIAVLLLTWLGSQLPRGCQADDSYETINGLMDSIMASGTYNPDLRPLANQSDTLFVDINFALMSIVDIDDVEQRFLVNGFLSLQWTDQRISWDPNDYGGVNYLTPKPKNIWRPRILLWNTLSDRDLFKDDYSPLRVRANGMTTWNPGGLFRGGCTLNMEKYPFDEQWCYIMMCPMVHYWTKLEFVPMDEEFDLDFFTPSEGWDLTATRVHIPRIETDIKNKFSACPQFSFQIKRRPTFFIMNIILPVVLLAFLNSMVFIIPTASGEKIGFGITVLLALSVFLSTVSMMVPQSSNHIPLVTIYLFVLLMSSVLSVLASIIVVYLHHVGEEDESPSNDDGRDSHGFKRFLTRIGSTASVSPIVVNEGRLGPGIPDPLASSDDASSRSGGGSYSKNPYKVLAKYINRIGFVISVLALIVINVVFMILLQS